MLSAGRRRPLCPFSTERESVDVLRLRAMGTPPRSGFLTELRVYGTPSEIASHPSLRGEKSIGDSR